jgi:hypothetical protein
MKKYYLYLFCVLLCVQSCNAQENQSKVKTDYIKKLEKEIASNHFTVELFSDTVLFEGIDTKKNSTSKSEIKINWNVVKKTFKETDFIINYCKNNSNKKCFEIKNHKSIYLVELNANDKIIYVKEVKPKLPSNAPPN